MAETRARPAREENRFRYVLHANLWFWRRMKECEDPHMELIHDWLALPFSTQIRRWRAATPQDHHDDTQIQAYNPEDHADAMHG